MNKLNVLVFSTDYKPNGGGIAEHTYQIAKNLYKQGCKVSLLSIKKENYLQFDKNQLFKTYRITNISFLRNLFLFIYYMYARKNTLIVYIVL